MTDRTDARVGAGVVWLLAAIAAFVVYFELAAIGYSIGPRVLATLGVVSFVAPVLLGQRWFRERRR